MEADDRHPGIRRVDRQDVEVAGQPEMLKTIVENEDITLQVFYRPLTGGYSIRITDHGRNAYQMFRKHERLITGSHGVCEDFSAIGNDNSIG